MTGGMEVLGRNEWGARVFHGTMFLLAALATGSAAARLRGKRTGQLAALMYATSLGPFVAANILTPDMPLAAAVTCLTAAYLHTLPVDGDRKGRPLFWWAAAGLAGGAGFLAKGPAILVFGAPVAVHAGVRAWTAWRSPDSKTGHRETLRRLWLGPALAAAIATIAGGTWYGLLFRDVPGAFGYVLDNQIVGRLFTATYGRNAAPVNLLVYYPPVLLAGALPWVFLLPGWLARWGRRNVSDVPLRALLERAARGLLSGSAASFLVLSVFVPLAILSAASSRLPLYVLPLFGVLAIVEAFALEEWLERSAGNRVPSRLTVAAAGLGLALIALRGAGALVTRPNDTRALAGELSRRLEGVSPPLEVVAVDLKTNALPFYGFTDFEWVTSKKDPYPFFVEPVSLENEIMEERDERETQAFLVEARSEPFVFRDLRDAGMHCTSSRLVHGESLILCPPSARSAASAPPG
jgi:4-amino-4-deoxy-L-arabinose transferase